LEREVGVLIVGVACWPGQRRFQAGELSLLSRVGQALTSAVVRLEDTKRFTIFGDHFAANSPNPSTDSVGRGNKELTVRKLLNQDFAIGAVSEAFNPMRKGHDVAVANSPDLHDLHRGEYTRVYTACQVHSARRLEPHLKAMAGSNWSELATLFVDQSDPVADALGRFLAPQSFKPLPRVDTPRRQQVHGLRPQPDRATGSRHFLRT